jgi:hypothetical protein
MFTFSDELFSDLWKDVNGYRPTQEIKDEWNARTLRQKQELWTALVDELDQQEQDRIDIQNARVASFEKQILQYEGMGDNITRSDAIRLILEEKGLIYEYDPEYVAYSMDLPYGVYTEEFSKVITGSDPYERIAV